MKIWRLVSILSVISMALVGCGGGAKQAPTTSSTTPAVQSAASTPTVTVKGPNIEAIQKRGKLIVGTKHDVPKFGYKDPETNKVDGYEIDLVRQIAKSILGDENAFETVAVTPQTRVAMLNSGEIDLVVATMTITEQRKQEVDFSPVYYTDGIGLLVPKSLGVSDLKGMAGKTVGVVKNASTGPRLSDKAKELGVDISFAEFSSYPEIKAALVAGQVQAMATDGAILAGYVDAQTVLLPQRYTKEPYGIATKKGADDMRQLVEKVVQDLEGKGDLARLQDKWGIRVDA